MPKQITNRGFWIVIIEIPEKYQNDGHETINYGPFKSKDQAFKWIKEQPEDCYDDFFIEFVNEVK